MDDKSLKQVQQVGPLKNHEELKGQAVDTVWTATVEQNDKGEYIIRIAYSIACKSKELLHSIVQGIPKMYQHVPINLSTDSDIQGYSPNYLNRRLSFRNNERKDKAGNFVYERSEVFDGLSADRLQEWYDMTLGLGFDKVDIKENPAEILKLFREQFSGLVAGTLSRFVRQSEEER